MRVVYALTAVPMATLLATAAATAQTRAELIVGRVTGPAGEPISGAEVTAVMAPERATARTRTDSSGAFALRFTQGTGDYLLYVAAPGWQPWRERLRATGADSVLVVKVTLSPRVFALDPLVARAERQRPARRSELTEEVGAADAVPDGVAGALAPDQMGNFAELAATVPGITATPSGITALGLAGQSSTTLNGLAFSGTEIPRDVRTQTRVSYSTYDPARGGFGSAQVNVELAPGLPFTFRRAHLSVDAPPLQLASGPAGEGAEFSRAQGSVGAEGELVPGRIFYNVGVQADRRTADAPSLLDAGEASWRRLALAPDSLQRLLAVLGAVGVPIAPVGLPDARTTRRVSFLGRVDHTPSATARRSFGLVGYASVVGTEVPAPLAALSTPGSGGRRRIANAGVQAIHSAYVGRAALSETRSALSLDQTSAEPYLRLPSGRVLISSTSSTDSAAGAAEPVFGGAGDEFTGAARNWRWETFNETQWFARGNRHRVKLYAQSRVDGYARHAGEDAGAFTFASLNDLSTGRPTRYSRLLRAPDARGTAWSGAFALGDLWNVSPRLQLLYGARLEANRYLTRPAENAALPRLFGVDNTRAPNTVGVSPRLGFTWLYGRTEVVRGLSVSPIGTRITRPKGILRGGIGEFRALLPPDLLAPAQIATGLRGGAVRLTCFGAAAPAPAWSAYAADPSLIPTRCADGSGGSVFGDAAPEAALFAGGYTAPRSLRANLAWSPEISRLNLAVEGIVSLNLSQPGWADLNFGGVPRFSMADEGGRPVFVSPSSIDTISGAVSPVEARRGAEFGRVTQYRSDLRSVSRQLTISAAPELNFGRYFVALAYTLGSVRALENGFAGSTGGSPAERAWGPAPLDVRHQILVQAGWNLPGKLSFTLFGRLASGAPYTPLVAADVNGDGLANDRAFVFDAAIAPDTALDTALAGLRATAPSGARDCLAREAGRIAARGACRGPWTAAMNARLQFTGALLRTGRRLDLAVNIANPLAALDRLVNGREGMRGWGSPAAPDPRLYFVRGFDAEAQRFRYAVNPRFGADQAGIARVRAPFRITIEARFDLGPSVDRQQLERWLRPGRNGRAGTPLSATALARRYARTVTDVYASVLELSDSLLLAPEQVRALEEAQRPYRARTDSVWNELGGYLAALPDRYDSAEALARQRAAAERVWAINAAEAPIIRSILIPAQLRLLPDEIREILEGTGRPGGRTLRRD